MSAQPPILPIFRAEDASGASLPFALLYTYAAGTTTPLATYQDAAGLIPNSNPVVCDANGLAVVYLTAGVSYKLLLTDQYGTVQPKFPVDGVTGGVTGATGAAGSVWRDGSGVPSNAIGVNGDYYLNTDNGDVYVKAGGAYGIKGNIQGPPGSTRNAILNGSFYGGLNCWTAYAAPANGVVPTSGNGRRPNSQAPNLFAASTLGLVTAVGEVAQGFPIQKPAGTTTLTFYTAAWLESVAPFTTKSAYVKVYLHDAQTDTEVLLATYNYTSGDITTTYATAPWTMRSIDVSASLPAAGTYGLRFELQAISDNTGGAAGSKGVYVAVDDIAINVTSAGVTGPQGIQGIQGPAGPSGGGKIQTQAFTANGSWTAPAGVNWADVTCVGAGAGGGQGAASARGGGGSGGGAGASIRRRVPVTPLSSYTITIGTKGNGAGIGVAATDGTDTTFGTLVTAKGGIHGAPGATLGAPPQGGASPLGGGGVLTGVGLGAGSTFPSGNAMGLVNGFGAAVAGGSGGGGGQGSSVSPAANGTNGLAGGRCESADGGSGGLTDTLTGGGGGGGSSAFGVGGVGGATGSPGVSAALTAYGAGGGGGGGAVAGTVGGDGAPGYCLVEWIA